MAARNSRKIQGQLSDLLELLGKHIADARSAHPGNHLSVHGALADANATLQQILLVFGTQYNAILDGYEAEIAERDQQIANLEALLAKHAPGVAPDTAQVLRLVRARRKRRERRRRTGN
jgi:hypothetical protein